MLTDDNQMTYWKSQEVDHKKDIGVILTFKSPVSLNRVDIFPSVLTDITNNF